MRDEFYFECYLTGSSGAVKLGEMACERTEEERTNLARTLTSTYRPSDADNIELRVRRATAEDAVEVARGLMRAVKDAWSAAYRGLLKRDHRSELHGMS